MDILRNGRVLNTAASARDEPAGWLPLHGGVSVSLARSPRHAPLASALVQRYVRRPRPRIVTRSARGNRFALCQETMFQFSICRSWVLESNYLLEPKDLSLDRCEGGIKGTYSELLYCRIRSTSP